MSLSGQNLTSDEIVDHYADCRSALRTYFSRPEDNLARFGDCSAEEIALDLRKRLAELELTQSLVLLATIEAAFRIDFAKRCTGPKKIPLGKEFRSLKRTKGDRVGLDQDILEAWKTSGILAASLISEIRGAMNLRHWLAHGRYWPARLGRRYDFDSLVNLSDALNYSGILLK